MLSLRGDNPTQVVTRNVQCTFLVGYPGLYPSTLVEVRFVSKDWVSVTECNSKRCVSTVYNQLGVKGHSPPVGYRGKVSEKFC